MTTPDGAGAGAAGAVSPTELARRLTVSERLRRRRFEVLALSGPDAAFSEPQGRAPGPSTAPANLAELISSIATVGVLQPILVEELPGGQRRVVAGERRLRATRWGAVHLSRQPALRRHRATPHFLWTTYGGASTVDVAGTSPANADSAKVGPSWQNFNPHLLRRTQPTHRRLDMFDERLLRPDNRRTVEIPRCAGRFTFPKRGT